MGCKDSDPRAAHLEAAKVSGKGEVVLCMVIIWANNPKQAEMAPSRGMSAGLDSAPASEGIKSHKISLPGVWGCVTAHGPLLLRNLSSTSFPCHHGLHRLRTLSFLPF